MTLKEAITKLANLGWNVAPYRGGQFIAWHNEVRLSISESDEGNLWFHIATFRGRDPHVADNYAGRIETSLEAALKYAEETQGYRGYQQ